MLHDNLAQAVGVPGYLVVIVMGGLIMMRRWMRMRLVLILQLMLSALLVRVAEQDVPVPVPITSDADTDASCRAGWDRGRATVVVYSAEVLGLPGGLRHDRRVDHHPAVLRRVGRRAQRREVGPEDGDQRSRDTLAEGRAHGFRTLVGHPVAFSIYDQEFSSKLMVPAQETTMDGMNKGKGNVI